MSASRTIPSRSPTITPHIETVCAKNTRICPTNSDKRASSPLYPGSMASNSISVSVNLNAAPDTAESNYLPLQNLCSWGGNEPTQASRGDEAVRAGVGEVHSSEEPRNERGAKGPQFQGSVTSGKRAEIGESLPPQIKLWELQETLHAKAKGNPSYRFYALYDKVYRADVLAEAWRR